MKHITIYEINISWSEKTVIEGLKSLESGKMLFPFTSWPVKYLLNFLSNSKRDPAASGIWECHDCHEAVVIPGTDKNIHGEIVRIDPKTLNPNTEVIRF